MADRRTIARIGVRSIGGVIGVAVAVVVVGGASLLPLPTFAVPAPAQTVKPVPADQQRVCPGSVLALAADTGQATRPSALGQPTVTSGTDGPKAAATALRPDADTTSSKQAPGVLTVQTPAGAKEPPLFAGSQVQTVTSDDLTGLAASACSEATADSWLVAGSTSLGQTSLVLLANPTSVDATVDLSIWTETGAVDAPGATGIVVPAGAQKVVPLAGLAPSATAPVVHVIARGGQVVATMQQSYEQGIEPRGVELSGATSGPSRTQIIPGLTVASMDAVQAAQSAEGVNVDFPALRVLVPGTEDAQLTVGTVGEAGTAVGDSFAQTVKAGSVAELPLQHLKDGSYTVTVHSSVPVVVAARTTSVGTKSRDFAWFGAALELGDSLLATMPGGPNATLHLANAGDSDKKVTVKAADGHSSTLTVPAEGGAPLRLPGGAYTLTGASGLRGSVSVQDDGAASSFVLTPPGALAAPIAVYPR
ncbi:DUF5719 family protein [Leifsonia sp. AG29]|uniref:DUF5719 family protein n=1 Tax=Leifsonia sp. AG29 TaxID=2598860 RepID=UPI00131BFA00|nr:DUF5719 family protein [Leifsonia sp. AG29]